MKFKVMMYTVLIVMFFTLIVSLMSEDINATSSDNDDSRRILGGSEVTPHSIPYQVYLLIKTRKGLSQCGGSLITRRAVLTAAHCVKGVKKVKVLLGAHDRNEIGPSQVVLVSTDYIIHPYYETTATRNDVAIVKLPRSVELNDYIQLIPLQSKSEIKMSFVNQTGTVSGWGRTSNDIDKPTKLRSVSTRIISNEECSIKFWQVVRSQICLEVGDKAVCGGDSGGPLTAMINNQVKQIGIASYQSLDGCVIGSGSAFTRLTYYLDWIEANNKLSTKDFKIRGEFLLILSLLIMLF